jgi:hypothetical protein
MTMTQSPPATKSPWQMARRAVFLTFTLGLVSTVALMLLTALRVRELDGSGTVATKFLTVVFFSSTRTVSADTSTVSLSPGLGVFVLLVVLPALAGALAYRRSSER